MRSEATNFTWLGLLNDIRTEFITADVYKYADKVSELTDSCKEKLRKEYSITEEESSKISLEGLKKRWPLPERDFIPNCCK